MRLAVFTNQFPSPISTFFARDLRSLIDCGMDPDVFALYPHEPEHWEHVPSLLDERVLPRERVHHCSAADIVRAAIPRPGGRWGGHLSAATPYLRESIPFGPSPTAKTAYAAAAAWEWSQRFPHSTFDHVLAYWGNYPATSALLYHRMTHPDVPFSMFARARVDLYRHPVRLAPKFRYADNIFLVCEYNRGVIRENYPEAWPAIEGRIRLHYSGLPLDEIPFVLEGRAENTVVAVGRFEPLKGFTGLIRAVGQLAGRGHPVRLELIGAGEQDAELRALAAQLGLASRVSFPGFLPPDQTIGAISRATILAHTPVERDAMPNVLKEALATGTPAIASDLAGAPEILAGGRAGILVPPGDITALAQAIERLLADAPLRERLALAGRQHMEEHFDMWHNGRALAARLRETRRGVGKGLAHAG